MTGKMTNLTVLETSGVDHPAHLHEGFLVMKAADRTQAEAVVSAFGKKESTVTEKSTASSVTAEDITKAVDKAIQPILDQLAEGWKSLRDFAEKTDSDTPSAEAAAATDAPAADPALAAETQQEMALSADVLKSAPEAVIKAIESQRAEIAKAREEVAKERDIRLDGEAVTFAKATWPNLGLPEETVKSIRRVSVVDADLGETLKQMLTSANAQLDGSSILGELGTGGTSDNPTVKAVDRVEDLAKALVEEGKYDTIQKARVAVYNAEPELATAVKEEAR